MSLSLSLNGLVRLYDKGLSFLPPLQSIFLFLLRFYWGWLFAQAGYGKLTHIERTTEFFKSLGMPLPELNAYFIGLTEFLGGFLLGLGLGTHLVGLFLTGEMFVAYLIAHRSELASLFSDPSEFYTAPPFTFLFVSVVLFLFGAGKVSLDYLISKVVGGLK
ncbi:DoxX family protein [Hydrogenivirga sp.]